MARYSAAYSDLLKRLSEVETLLRLAKNYGRTPPIPPNVIRVNSLCRSGVVLLSSHIEGFIEDLSEIALDRIGTRQLAKNKFDSKFRYYLSKDLIVEIKNTNDPTRVVQKIDLLIDRDKHIWGAGPNFNALTPEIFLRDFSNPKHDRIKNYFGRFGYDRFHTDLQTELAARFVPCKNMIDQVVDQRNKIAHGDSLTTGTPSDLETMLSLTKEYCRAVDKVVGDWFKSKGCSLR